MNGSGQGWSFAGLNCHQGWYVITAGGFFVIAVPVATGLEAREIPSAKCGSIFQGKSPVGGEARRHA